MKYFIVADVHGFYTEMLNALASQGFDVTNPDHTFVSLGDLLDRGPRPIACLRYVNSLPRKILVRGNHEDLLDEAFARGRCLAHDYTNGTNQTVQALYMDALSYARNNNDVFYTASQNTNWVNYRAQLCDYYETPHCIFVHGWIPHNVEHKGFNMDYSRHDYRPHWRETDADGWELARWYNGMEAWADGVREPNKTIFCGHYHTSWARCHIDNEYAEWTKDPAAFAPWKREGIVALDACTAWTHKVNCVVVEET